MRVMVDLETMGVGPRAAVVAIGAVAQADYAVAALRKLEVLRG